MAKEKTWDIDQLLKTCGNKKVEDIMKEFAHSPWDFNVIGPMGLSDAPEIIVYIKIGRTRCLISYRIVIKLLIPDVDSGRYIVNDPEKLDKEPYFRN